MFSTPESGKISDTWTAVRILGGDDLDEEGEAFMRRYGASGFPTLMAITAGGDLVARDLLGGRLVSADDLFARMAKADEANQAFLAQRDEAKASGDVAKLRALADAYVARTRTDLARPILEQVLRKDPSVASHEALAGVLRRLGDADAEKDVLGRCLAAHPDHEDAIQWRMRLATMHVQPPTDPDGEARALTALVEALEPLRAELAEAGDVAGEAAVRLRLANLETARGREEVADGHTAWILEHAAATPVALDARIFLAERAYGRRDEGTAKTLAEAVLEAAPESQQAARAHMMLGDIAFANHEFEAMGRHFEAVIELAPSTPYAEQAQQALDFLARRRAER